MSNTANRMNQVTQRLDHMVPDPKLTLSQNADAAAELLALSEKLATLLPDPSLSPEERLERLARVVQDRVPHIEHLQPAAAKVHKLKTRINELVPSDDLSAEEKISKLAAIALGQCGVNDVSCVEALERIGDPRASIDPVK